MASEMQSVIPADRPGEDTPEEKDGVDRQRTIQRIITEVFPLLANGLLEEHRRRVKSNCSLTDDDLITVHRAATRLLFRSLIQRLAEDRVLSHCESLASRIRSRSRGPIERPIHAPPSLAERQVSDHCLAQAMRTLECVEQSAGYGTAGFDPGAMTVRHLGTIYERLLEFRLHPVKRGNRRGNNAVELVADKAARKSGGSYFTPDWIVRYIIEQTVGPVLEEKLHHLQHDWRTEAAANTDLSPAGLVERLNLRVLDPALGCGYFLAAAAAFIAHHLSEFLHAQRFRSDNDPCERRALKREVMRRCLFGIDRDPVAVELARSSLRLDAGLTSDCEDVLDEHLQCGDALSADVVVDSNGSGMDGFDAVIGNPPYSGHKTDFDTRRLKAEYTVCRHNPNPAAAFLERGFQLLRDGGRLGMIVPKSLQYVESWQACRRLLVEENSLEQLADVSRAFDGVLLEQTVCIAAKRKGNNAYRAVSLCRSAANSRAISRRMTESLGCFPAAVEEPSMRLLRKIQRAGPRLGEIARTSQALGDQAKLNRDVTGERVPIQRGRQIRPMRIDPAEDFIDRAFLIHARTGRLRNKCRDLLQPKVLSQNIVAHVTRPKPRVWIISAPDHEGVLCLNTISATRIHKPGFPLDYVAAVLNSTLASWFYTEFVFCRAIRTMHFDNYYAGKLPIAEIGEEQMAKFERLAQTAAETDSRTERQAMIDEAVFDAYRLTPTERGFLYDYCYS